MSLLIDSSLLKVNLDTVVGRIGGMEFHVPHSDRVVLYGEGGQKKAVYGNRIEIKGRHRVHSLQYRVINGGELEFEGSIFGCKFGQNLFTDSDVLKACKIAIRKIVKHANMNVDEALMSRWLDGEVKLKRVDLVVNFRMKSEGDVERVLKQVRRQLIEQHGPTQNNQSSVCWSPQGGKHYSVVFYNKGAQVRSAKRNSDDKPQYWAALEMESENILRVEVRLRSSELRKLNLSRAKDWAKGAAENAFLTYLNKLKLFNVTTGPISESELQSCPRGLRPVLALHKLGAELEQIYSQRSCQRHRDAFRKHNIDLRCPNQSEATSVKLLDYLTGAKVITKAPQWMIDAGIAADDHQMKSKSANK